MDSSTMSSAFSVNPAVCKTTWNVLKPYSIIFSTINLLLSSSQSICLFPCVHNFYLVTSVIFLGMTELLRNKCSQNWPLFPLFCSDTHQCKSLCSFLAQISSSGPVFITVVTWCMYQVPLFPPKPLFFFFCQISVSSVCKNNNASATLITCTLQAQTLFVLC